MRMYRYKMREQVQKKTAEASAKRITFVRKKTLRVQRENSAPLEESIMQLRILTNPKILIRAAELGVVRAIFRILIPSRTVMNEFLISSFKSQTKLPLCLIL